MENKKAVVWCWLNCLIAAVFSSDVDFVLQMACDVNSLLSLVLSLASSHMADKLKIGDRFLSSQPVHCTFPAAVTGRTYFNRI
jgi:hypothetical protein